MLVWRLGRWVSACIAVAIVTAGCGSSRVSSKVSVTGVASKNPCVLYVFLGSVSAEPLPGQLSHARAFLTRDPAVARVRPLGRLGFFVTPRARADTVTIAERLRGRFGPVIPTGRGLKVGTGPGCRPLSVGSESAVFPAQQVQHAFAAHGLRLSSEVPPPATPTVATLLPYGATDGTVVSHARNAVYLGSPGERPFHVIVFGSSRDAASLPLRNGSGFRLDLIRGNVFVRDEGMSARQRAQAVAVLRDLAP